MRNLSKLLIEVINSTVPALSEISNETAEIKPDAKKWSKKEILGHLIDSASNNHQRFVRAAQNEALNFPPYNQNQWVDVQQYNRINWHDLVELYAKLNLHIAHVLNIIPESAGGNLCNIGKENPVTMKLIAADYIRHMKHHLEKIFEQKN